MKKNILLIFLILVLVGIGGGLYMYFKPHPNLENQSADFEISSSELFTAFENDEAAANAQFLNALIEVAGEVSEVKPQDDGGYTLVLSSGNDMFGVNCAFLPEDAQGLEGLSAGNQVRIKGICAGMLMDVNLSRCVLLSE